MSRATVVVATAQLFLLMSIIEVHAQDACGCRKIADQRARAACVRGCSSSGTFQPQPTFQLQSTGRSGAASTGAPQSGSSVGPTIVRPPGTQGGSPAPSGSRGGRR